MTDKIKLFDTQQVRAEWDADHEKWWFSVVDIIAILTDQPDHKKVRNYWKWLKNKLVAEGSQLVSTTHQLKLVAADGKRYKTDVADTEQILRLIQSIPSKRAEPFKLWLAQVGSERLDETVDPEQSIERAIQNYRRLGYSENWINQRIKSIEVRKALTDEWDKAGVQQGQEYAALTDLMSRVWSGLSTREYKQHKGLKKENLRDNMTNTELVLNMLAEVAATDISLVRNPQGLAESATVAAEGAQTAKAARLQLEKSTGQPVVSRLNAKTLETDKIGHKKE
ncbi:BRO family protein [Castellaniella sp.]|uniref:BRO family protein n=1 Tax=Castellaniella sp. TaxID=1955812 RepID=UPI002AFFAF0B|nr:BRO family protein [Castellaniella sp.]